MASQTALYKQKNQEMMKLIEELTNVEEDLTLKLAFSNDKSVRQNLENSIRIVSQTKENLVASLGSLSTYYTANLENASNTLEQQTEAVGIIDREMQIAKKRLEYVNNQKANKTRQVEINQYYAANYREKTLLVKWCIALFIVVVIFIVLKPILNGISPILSALLLTIIIVYFGYNMLQILLSLSSRSKMVYDEYSWKFNKKSAPEWDSDVTGSNPFKLAPSTCIGEVCCTDGTLYNTDMGKCVPEVSTITGKCSPATA